LKNLHQINISGNSIRGKGKNRPLLFQSSTEYAKSMQWLLDESMQLLVTGHPFPPFNKIVLIEKESREYVKQSLKGIEELSLEHTQASKGTYEHRSDP
jgi:hypothetical protein